MNFTSAATYCVPQLKEESLYIYNDDQIIEPRRTIPIDFKDCLQLNVAKQQQDKIIVEIKQEYQLNSQYEQNLDIICLVNLHSTQQCFIQQIKDSIFDIINNMKQQDRLSIITYSSNGVKRLLKFTCIDDIQKINIMNLVQNMKYEDGIESKLISGLIMANDCFNERRFQNKISSLIILSDGIENSINLQNMYQALNRSQIQNVFTLYYRGNLRNTFINDITQRFGGNSMSYTSQNIENILSNLRSIIIQQLKITIVNYDEFEKIYGKIRVDLINDQYTFINYSIKNGDQNQVVIELQDKNQDVIFNIEYYDVQKSTIVNYQIVKTISREANDIIIQKEKAKAQQIILEALAISSYGENKRSLNLLENYFTEFEDLSDSEKEQLKQERNEVAQLFQQLKSLENFLQAKPKKLKI